ncbi:Endonuclease/exonuclease/phosphatase [Trinorchestia longiramus]|nr:Endonuclease/exonuclease/phosphatase [Trinorchestia longiramus]
MYLDLMSHYTGHHDLFKKDGIHINEVGQARLGNLLTTAKLGQTATLEEDKIGSVQTSARILKVHLEHQQGNATKNLDNCNLPNTELNDPRRRKKQTSLALQETLGKPQSYRQHDHFNWDNLSKTVISHHDYSLGLLKILVGNVQSLLPTMPELQVIASMLSHDIIAVNETWLDLNGRHLSAEVSMKGYVLHNVDKPSHSNRRGGSLINIKEILQPQIKTKRATEESEILRLTIEPHPEQTIKIVLKYRSPTCTTIEDDEIYDCLDNIFSFPHDTLIMEDFNLPHINWITRQSQAPGSKLIDLMNTNSLQHHVNKPTKGNILDLVMTTTDLSINGLEVTDKIGDYQMIDFTLEVQVPNTRTQHKQVLDYKRANFKLMKEELGSHNYQVLMSNKNAKECYMILKEKIATATEHHIPRKQIRSTNNLLWSLKRLNASSVQDNSRTKESNDTKQNPIVKNISTPAGLLCER